MLVESAGMTVNNFIELSKMKPCNNILSNTKTRENFENNLNSRA